MPLDRSQRFSAPLQVKFSQAYFGPGEFRGYASTFGGEPDSHGDIIEPGAFSDSLAEHERDGTRPVMLWSHDMERPIGKWLAVREDGRGLDVHGKLNLDTSAGREAYAHVSHGDVPAMSIGYSVPEGGRVSNGNGSYSLRKIALHEISLVTLPSNRRARISQIKSLGSRGELEDLLQSAGLPRGAVRKLAAGGWPALVGGSDDAPTASIVSRITAATRELKALHSNIQKKER